MVMIPLESTLTTGAYTCHHLNILTYISLLKITCKHPSSVSACASLSCLLFVHGPFNLSCVLQPMMQISVRILLEHFAACDTLVACCSVHKFFDDGFAHEDSADLLTHVWLTFFCVSELRICSMESVV